jgi:GT2 family glycosyltransferase
MTAQECRQTNASTLRLSVILCTYNRRELVLATLASLGYQTLAYEHYEVIVVDNGSTDGTLDALHIFQEQEVEQTDRNGQVWHIHCLQELRNGLAYARHKGLQVASGEIIVFLDDDTLAAPTFLEYLLAAYEQTQADAIGPRVELCWEARRPHWLSDDLCHLLGYFVPAETRIQLSAPFYFSNSCFSVKAAVLRKIGLPSPLLSKRLHAPVHMESEDLCRRLYRSGYALWYDPAACVIHRISAARLQRAFFRGQAYWQGRAEVLARYMEEKELQATTSFSPAHVFKIIRTELQNTIQSMLPNRSLRGQPGKKQLQVEMEQIYHWGRLSQTWQLIERTPIDAITPSVLLVHGEEHGAQLLKQSLHEQTRGCASSTGSIPFSWLWRHRAHLQQPIAIIHIYQPGALQMTWWQRQYFRRKIWLARQFGIRIVSTDAGGWWQYLRNLRALVRNHFEQKLFARSDLLLTYTPHMSQPYTDPRISQRIHYLAHPGMLGCYRQFPTRAQAYARLGLPPLTGFVYLCLAYLHDEHEIQFLIEAFVEAYWQLKTHTSEKPSPLTNPQLLILGHPGGQRQAIRILKHAATNPAIHVFLQASEEDTEVGMAAAHALILPHCSHGLRKMQTAGISEIVMAAYSYGRIIIAPYMPRFHDILPAQATISFTPDHHMSLVQALAKARQSQYQLNREEEQELEATRSWQAYTKKLLTLYQQILHYTTN